MSNINMVVLIGRLTHDAELRHTGDGTPLLKFSLAVNKPRRHEGQWQDEAHFFGCVMWGRRKSTADAEVSRSRPEALHGYLRKGRRIGVVGELQQSRWETKEGQRRSKVEVSINGVQLLDHVVTESVHAHNGMESTKVLDPSPEVGGMPMGDMDQEEIPF